MKNYSFLNTGLTIVYNGRRIHSRNGLVDLLRENMTNDPLYPIMHFTGTDIEVVITHANQYGEEYYSFVNGQHTTQGGTHLSAFREAVSRTIKEFYGKNFEYSDIRNGMVAAISIKVQEPVFESQTKTKLGSRDMSPDGSLTVAKFIGDFIKRELDNYLHIESQTAEIMLHKIQESEKERKAIAGVTKQTRERAKKASLNNKKLRDCRVHYCDAKGDRRDDTADVFIPASTLTTIRRDAVEALVRATKLRHHYDFRRQENKDATYTSATLTYADNVANHLARQFYADHGVKHIEEAMETCNNPKTGDILMTTRFCLRREYGRCLRTPEGQKWKSDLVLTSGNISMSVEFDCRNCQMLLRHM